MWVIESALSAVLIGLYEVARKAAVHDNAPQPTLLVSMAGGLLSMLPLLLIQWVRPDISRTWGIDLVTLGATEHLLVLLKAVLVSTAWTMSYRAVKHLPISIAGPLRATSPLFTALLALALFAERPAPAQWAGIALVVTGYLMLSGIGAREGIRFHQDRWVLLLVGGTLLGSLSGLYDKYLLQKVALPVTTMQFWFTVDCLAFQLVVTRIFWWPARHKERFVWRKTALLVGLLLFLADQLYLRAVAEQGALISVVSITRRSSVLVSFAVGGLLFQERFLRQKLGPLGLILAGLIVLLT